MKPTLEPQELKKRSEEKERGFSLIELLVASAIIVILAGLAIKAYGSYKQNSYNRIADTVFNQARAALEAGKIDSESFPASAMNSITVGPGEPSGVHGEILLPGLIIPKDTRVAVIHNPLCTDSSCIEDTIRVDHCKGSKSITYLAQGTGGVSTLLRNVAPIPCS